MIRPSAETKAAIVADYEAGMSTNAVAKKYGVSASSAHRYVTNAGVARTIKSAKTARYDQEYGLNDGHWTPSRRGVLVWQPCFHDSPNLCNINHQETRNAA